MGPATATQREANITQPDTFITVTLEGDVYGLPLSIIRCVVVVTDITPIPLAPASIAGLTNLRGRAATAIDLRRLLGYESRVPPMLGLAVEHDGNQYVLLVDEVGEVLSRPRRELLPAPEPEQSQSGRLCVGVCAAGDSLIAVLDPDLLLDTRFLTSFSTPA